jgi:hypothetical protein
MRRMFRDRVLLVLLGGQPRPTQSFGARTLCNVANRHSNRPVVCGASGGPTRRISEEATAEDCQ